MKNIKYFYNIYFLLIILFLGSVLYSCSQSKIRHMKKDPASKPNIIFILADDMGYGDPRAYNPQSKISTPNIDRLAMQGMRFTDAHAAAPWCTPSRYGLLTGQYPFRRSTGKNWKKELILPRQPTLATMLKKRGYKTGIVGKWHLGFSNFIKWNHDGYKGPLKGGPTAHGFDYYYGIPASADQPPYFYIKNDYAVHPPTGSIQEHHSQGWAPAQGAFWNGGKIAPDYKFPQVLPRLTREAVKFIGRNAQGSKPFFLYFALTAPHTPWVPLKKFKGSSGAGLYGDFCVEVDYEVGRIMKKVKQEGIQKNTILIFASDNGPIWFKNDIKRYGHRAAAMLRGVKFDTWEGGHRIPFIVRWPGKVKADTYSGALLDFTDMMATFAAITGDTLQENQNTLHDSYNQLPVWEGEKSSVRSILPIIDLGTTRSIRKGKWVLIMPSGAGGFWGHHNVKLLQDTVELYNLKADISENHNVYKKYPQKVKQLEQLMKKVISEGFNKHYKKTWKNNKKRSGEHAERLLKR
jgi:arylsulfatase A-like enzyme